MNRSYSKIRHIQNVNMLLERRYLHENDPEPDTTDNSVIIDMWTKKLPEAQKWWRDWLGHETTKTKFIKLNNLDITVADDYYKKYFNTIDNIKLIFHDINNFVSYESPNYTPIRLEPGSVVHITIVDYPGMVAFVFKNNPSVININLNNHLASNEINILGYIVHEIQHSLYYIFPLNPDQKVGEFASSADGCFDKNYKTFNDTKIDLINRIKMLAGDNIKNIATDLGVTEEDVVKFIKPFLMAAYSEFGYSRNYMFNKTEIDSFLVGTRQYFGINPSENLTKEQLKDYILNFNFKTSNQQVLYMIVHWAMKGFPPLEQFLNELNSFAKTDQIKQKTSPLDSTYEPKDYYS